VWLLKLNILNTCITLTMSSSSLLLSHVRQSNLSAEPCTALTQTTKGSSHHVFYFFFNFNYFIANWLFFKQTQRMIFNVYIIITIPTSFASMFCHSCKHFGIPKMCTLPWCTLNMVQELAWWWLCESKHVATFMIDNKISCVLTEPTLRIHCAFIPCMSWTYFCVIQRQTPI